MRSDNPMQPLCGILQLASLFALLTFWESHIPTYTSSLRDVSRKDSVQTQIRGIISEDIGWRAHTSQPRLLQTLKHDRCPVYRYEIRWNDARYIIIVLPYERHVYSAEGLPYKNKIRADS